MVPGILAATNLKISAEQNTLVFGKLSVFKEQNQILDITLTELEK